MEKLCFWTTATSGLLAKAASKKVSLSQIWLRQCIEFSPPLKILNPRTKYLKFHNLITDYSTQVLVRGKQVKYF